MTYSQREVLNKDEVEDLKEKIAEKCQCKVSSLEEPSQTVNVFMAVNPKMKYPTDLRHIPKITNVEKFEGDNMAVMPMKMEFASEL